MRQTAAEAYKFKRALIVRQIATLQHKLQGLDIDHENNSKDWSIVGSLAEVHNQLSETLGFLSDDIEELF